LTVNLDLESNARQGLAWLYLIDGVTREIGYGGAAGGGKSFLGCSWIVINCLQYKGTRYLIGRKELTNLKKTTLKTFFEACNALGLVPDVHYKYNGQMSTINFFNGSEVVLMDMAFKPSDPDYLRFGGLELTGAFVDESNESDMKALDILSSRLGRCKNELYGLVPKLYETFNPSKNHVYSRFWLPFKNDNMPAGRIFIRALATDNPFLSRMYIEQLEKADEVTRERLLHGNFDYDDDERALVSFKQIMDCFSNTFVPEGDKRLSADLAMQGRDNFVVGLFNGLRISFPLIMPKATGKVIEEQLKGLAHTYSVRRSNTIADSDGMGQYLESYMQGIEQFRAGKTPYDRAFANLRHECAFKLAEFIRKGELFLDVPETQRVVAGGREYRLRDLLVEELGQLKIDNASLDKDQKKRVISKDIVKQNIGRSPDLLDVLIMGMFYYVANQEIGVLSC
jgi:phage terminase large subunit